VPLFGRVDEAGIPVGWIELMRASMRTLGPAFSAARMLADYRGRIYGA
jgi:starch phosphorylase